MMEPKNRSTFSGAHILNPHHHRCTKPSKSAVSRFFLLFFVLCPSLRLVCSCSWEAFTPTQHDSRRPHSLDPHSSLVASRCLKQPNWKHSFSSTHSPFGSRFTNHRSLPPLEQKGVFVTPLYIHSILLPVTNLSIIALHTPRLGTSQPAGLRLLAYIAKHTARAVARANREAR